jgi:tRNA 2-thiocytidine biosynthesis protein TtcA
LQRARVKQLIGDLEKTIPNIRSSMMTALANVAPSHLLDANLFDFKNFAPTVGNVEAELDAAIGHVNQIEQPPALVSLS